MGTSVSCSSPLSDPSGAIAASNEVHLASSSVAELMMIQDAAGTIVAFGWQAAAAHDIEPAALVGQGMGALFAPSLREEYFDRLKRVLSSHVSEPFRATFVCRDQVLLFDLVMSPVLLPNGTASHVVVTGAQISQTDAVQLPICKQATDYQAFLTQIGWNIRQELELPIIWQRTVDGLSAALGLSRSLLCPYNLDRATMQAVAECCDASVTPFLGVEFQLNHDPVLQAALETLEPIATMTSPTARSIQADAEQPPHPRLLVATHYQDQPNALLILDRCDCTQSWTQTELEFVRELADQVGTAIAHAALFIELQRANENLTRQHRELEEARASAEEASRLKSEFLANTSHELRTPLNGMIGFLKLILDGMAEDPQEQREFIEEAHRSAMHLLEIINDVLDIAKIEAGKMQIECSPVSLAELLTQVETMTRTQVRQKNLSFEIQLPQTHDEVLVYGNYQRLLQVLLNLMGNAIKFTHEGGITISAEVIKKRVIIEDEELPGMVKIRVADTGIGVSLDKQDKLFQSFSQVDGSLTRQYGGTGLGLAISQKLVETMGGVVNFYSMGEGLGSTVTFTVPLYQEPVMMVTT